ncbi:uncharacterized protein LOC112556835 [Pomacea canaliculata]|uniref:uncharacterized protein LOC112556835 n=1 Tax=Pomacea canaliculata TaxID=400727 RepID=UPI000D73D2D0|nr:uncharacterized protein LOC112556835 [Pomacea canaliculata]XP_025081999.1 uncharacterized protein LOC112556835 [Pomacea canaliculata]XP_025082000.1 uncharacterized protein LOC112556835 [Pomacea canaliculata]XP_025082001.1 uncharacterized protein LOC112556835 [Pomacea canaliculata]
MDDDTFLVGGFDLGHLILAFVIVGIFALIVYCLWAWPCGENCREQPLEGRVIPYPGRGTKVHDLGLREQDACLMYAMELEPGTFILESSDGELFRVLHEYDSLANQGTPSRGFPAGAVVPVHYIPAYTRAHVQTRPSAPHVSLVEDDEQVVRHWNTQPWRPLCVQTGSG